MRAILLDPPSLGVLRLSIFVGIVRFFGDWISHPRLEFVGTTSKISHQTRKPRTAKNDNYDDHKDKDFLRPKSKHRDLLCSKYSSKP